MSKAKSTKAKSTKAKSTKAKSTKAKSTKAKSTKAKSTKGEKDVRSSGLLKGGTEVGLEKGDSTIGGIKVGGEVGVDSDYSLGEFKEVADDALDRIKAGLKAARKKISDLQD
jgi:hypothetical protein